MVRNTGSKRKPDRNVEKERRRTKMKTKKNKKKRKKRKEQKQMLFRLLNQTRAQHEFGMMWPSRPWSSPQELVLVLCSHPIRLVHEEMAVVR